MRLFISSSLSTEAVNELMRAEALIREQGVRGNYSPARNLHLTLAFIGEYSDTARVLSAMRTVPFKPFEVSLSRLGCFGDLWWCGLDCPEELFAYVTDLRKALTDAGIPVDAKRFRPHVTLLRRADREFRVPVPGKKTTAIREIALMRSERGESGMIYTPVGKVAAS
ncbi:MAG: RNA 2',3'-cyclic phosphodiesterase [Clostridia bacterium]|nr:RNA 2',3'-cyclic phosphodiesterase [Clostridia bacterium]